MAETLALAPVQDPEPPLDVEAIRSRFDQLHMLRGAGDEEPVDVEDTALGLRSGWEVSVQDLDVWDSDAAALGSDGLEAYIEWLRNKVSLAEEENRKLSKEINATGETAFRGTVLLDADIQAVERSLITTDSKGLEHSEASITGLSVSTDSGRNQTNVEKDYKYEVLEVDYQIGKSETDWKLLELQSTSMQRDEAMREHQSMLSRYNVLECNGNCLRVFLKTPILTPGCVIYGQKMDCVSDSFVSDHELVIEVDEGSMEVKKVQIFPSDIYVDILIEKLKSSREVISVPSLGWLIRQCQHHIIINTLRRSLVNDANNSRHSFEYLEKDETIVAHLVGAIDVFIKITADWPLSSYGLKLISIRNSGTQPMDISLNLLCKTKELANGLDLLTRQHLVRFVDAVEEILVRERQSELHASRGSG